ncbi:hypothetical protein Ae201684P_020371 [Aphanomyces euteiches]|uniref:CCHC-type domain-containing protein n=1 Tax=Aphanomyces euteiches TaxID=100861 RepID=A0A6G0WFH0_9STRA|nr:hypothetical protein Ae201684_015574 [Aphanomyces euteiches]KAH9084114.1 hypothetical protein Ae201684P_020371 [Aphanomyces euteiches]
MFVKFACPIMTTQLRSYLSQVNHDSPVATDKAVEGLIALTGSAGINYNRRNSRIVPKGQANSANGQSNSRGGRANGGRGRGQGRGSGNGRGAKGDPTGKTCFNCLQLGHYASDCKNPKSQPQALATTATPEQAQPAPTQIHGAAAVASSPNNSSDRDSDDDVLTSNIWFVSAEEHIQNAWLLDSGCSHHMTCDLGAIHNVVPADLAVEVANKAKIHSKCKGEVRLTLANSQRVVLKEVYYIPDLGMNLISVTQLTQRGLTVRFSSQSCSINQDNLIMGTATRNGLLWTLDISSIDRQTREKARLPGSSNFASKHIDTLNGWHKRLGHLNKPMIIRMVSHLSPDQMQISRSTHDLKVQCIECAIGKQPRSAQPLNDTSQLAPTDIPGAVICMDLKGKIKPQDRYGNRYLAVFVDHGSGYVEAVPIHRKSQALAEKGISQQLTERATSASNGKAERMIRTLMDMARAMLF